MKKTFITTLIGVSLLLAFVYLVEFNKQKSVQETAENKLVMNVAQKEFAQKENALKAELGRELTRDEQISLFPKNIGHQVRMAEAMNQDAIFFYGIVLDQYGQPVEGAKIDLGFGSSGLSGGSQGRRVSDEQGRFSVENIKGSMVTVYGITNPEINSYKRVADMAGNFLVKTGIDFYGHQPNVAAKELLWRDFSDPNKPYQFKVWRFGEPENVFRSELGHAFIPDERIYTLNLLKRGVGTPGQFIEGEGEGEGQLKFKTYVAPLPAGEYYAKNPRQSWIEIEAINGGIVEPSPDDAYLNLAPESGYQSVYRFETTITSSVNKRIYYKSNDLYGVISMILEPIHPSGLYSVPMEHKINLDGTRNLEVIPQN